MSYVGRFAPSPTGRLHFGSLAAAVASYLEAKSHHGKWLVRMEDLDKPREMPGAAKHILQTLERFEFEWDGEVIYQSKRYAHYEEALNQLTGQQLVYPCTCTRKEIADSAIHFGIEGAIYPKTCLQQPIKPSSPMAWRIKTPASIVRFNDSIQGEISHHLSHDIGDFILRRADDLFAYQLAVTVDDAMQGITHVVRGADLLGSTPRQIYLQQMLAYQQPTYAHIPVAVNAHAEKLSKQTLAKPLDEKQTAIALYHALQFLGQNPPDELRSYSINDCWRWAFHHWQLKNVAKFIRQQT
ncbi:MAG: tRNA glutamyl-Q(34) synthetase GluQRS [Methylophilaceae bacterium]